MSYRHDIRQLLLHSNITRLITFGRDSSVPERNILLGYLVYMAIGFGLLMLPWSRHQDASWLDNLFTAVSAVSTTGLATVDIPGTYTILGQAVILLLIQIGGIGYMTMSSYIFFKITHHADYTGRVIDASISRPQGMELQDLINNIIHFTFIFELIGFVSFFMALSHADAPLPGWNALFLSVSSFCTAGFSPFSDSLCSFSDNIAINLTVAVLSYAGAMGFIVITDILYKIKRCNYRLTFTTKVIVLVTAIMTVGGTMILTFSPTMDAASHGWPTRVLLSFFQTMSAMTTVGFNTVDLSTLRVGPILVFALIMFIGASPSGTGGGVKSTSVSAVWGFVISKLGLRKDVTFLGRHIPHYRVDTALTSIIVYGLMIFLGCVTLSYSEPFPLSQILFESASAIGTVGLSTGITPELSAVGKVAIIVLMYIGRVGVITFGTALIGRLKERNRQAQRHEDLAA